MSNNLEEMKRDNSKRWAAMMTALKEVKGRKKEVTEEENTLKKNMQQVLKQKKTDALLGGGGYVTWYEVAGSMKLDEEELEEEGLYSKKKVLAALKKLPKKQRDLVTALLTECEIDLVDFYTQGKTSKRFNVHFDMEEMD